MCNVSENAGKGEGRNSNIYTFFDFWKARKIPGHDNCLYCIRSGSRTMLRCSGAQVLR